MAHRHAVESTRRRRIEAPSLVIAVGAAMLALAATLALAVTAIVRVLMSVGGAGGDFLSFYAAGEIVRAHGGAGLYDGTVQAAIQRAAYPGTLENATGYPLPVFAAYAFAPLSMLPFAVAFLAWSAINLGALFVLAATLYRFLARVPALPRRVFVAVFALSIPVVTNIVFGQVDLFVFAAIFGAYLLLRGERPVAAGAVLALVLLKPHFLVGIVTMLAMQRQWRSLLALLAVGLPLLVLPALLTSPHLLWANLGLIGHYPSASGGELQVNAAMMSNWRGFVVSATGRSDIWLWLPGLAALALAAFIAALPRWRRRADPARGYALAVIVPLLASPHLHTQSLVLLFVPAALALHARFDHPTATLPHASADATTLLLALYVGLFVLWVTTTLGLSLMVFLIASVFVSSAYHWPEEASATNTDSTRNAEVELAA